MSDLKKSEEGGTFLVAHDKVSEFLLTFFAERRLNNCENSLNSMYGDLLSFYRDVILDWSSYYFVTFRKDLITIDQVKSKQEQKQKVLVSYMGKKLYVEPLWESNVHDESGYHFLVTYLPDDFTIYMGD